MSHKTEVQINIDNKEALMQALEEMGYTLREGHHTLKAFSWTIDCDFSVLKNGKQLNIGFKEQPSGRFSMEADWWATGINEAHFTDQMNQLHAKHKVQNWLTRNRYTVSHQEEQDGTILLTGTRWAS